jgi:hypothetical protein
MCDFCFQGGVALEDSFHLLAFGAQFGYLML